MKQDRVFRLFDLPAELRENIYEKIFESESTFVTKHGAEAPALLLSNKRIYNEAIEIFWMLTVFHFSSGIDGYKWFRRLNPKLRTHVTRTRCSSQDGLEGHQRHKSYESLAAQRQLERCV